MDVTKVQVSFTISSEMDFNHDYVTDKMEIVPTYLRKKGELLGNKQPFHLTEWGIETEYEPSLDINIQLSKITEQIKNKTNTINAICSENYAECHFVIVIAIENGQIPATVFCQEFIQFAASINAQIGIDMYVYSM